MYADSNLKRGNHCVPAVTGAYAPALEFHLISQCFSLSAEIPEFTFLLFRFLFLFFFFPPTASELCFLSDLCITIKQKVNFCLQFLEKKGNVTPLIEITLPDRRSRAKPPHLIQKIPACRLYGCAHTCAEITSAR